MNQFTFHHIGIPTDQPKPNERYSELFKMYTADDVDSPFRKQWHRFEPDSPLDDAIKTQPHVAFKVDSLQQAIADKKCILGPYEPLPGFHVAVYKEAGLVIELIETTLTDAEIWGKALKQKSALYPESKDC